MKMLDLTCPKCNANLSIDADRKEAFCSYCGTKLLLDNDNAERVYRRIDEAAIKHEENERMRLQYQADLLRLQEEKENKKAKKEKVKQLSIYGGAISVVIGFALAEAMISAYGFFFFVFFGGLAIVFGIIYGSI